MVIKNLNNEYEVIQKMKSYSKNTVYQCRYQSGGKVRVCDIIHLKDMAGNREVITYFNTILLKQLWQDLIECFVKKESIYVVVKSHPYSNLAELLMEGGHSMEEKHPMEGGHSTEEAFSLPERARIFENLCERIILQNMPYYILYDGLQKEHVVVNQRLEVYMQYDLDHIRNYHEYTMEDICDSVFFWLNLIFKKECRYKSSEQLMRFKARLKWGKSISRQEFQNYMDLYKAYMEVNKELLQLYEEGVLYVHRTLPYRIWEQIKKFVSRVKYILLVLILVLTVGVSIVVYRNHLQKVHSNVSVLDRIGTVEIEGGWE